MRRTRRELGISSPMVVVAMAMATATLVLACGEKKPPLTPDGPDLPVLGSDGGVDTPAPTTAPGTDPAK